MIREKIVKIFQCFTCGVKRRLVLAMDSQGQLTSPAKRGEAVSAWADRSQNQKYEGQNGAGDSHPMRTVDSQPMSASEMETRQPRRVSEGNAPHGRGSHGGRHVLNGGVSPAAQPLRGRSYTPTRLERVSAHAQLEDSERFLATWDIIDTDR